jgi:hypothetical protein
LDVHFSEVRQQELACKALRQNLRGALHANAGAHGLFQSLYFQGYATERLLFRQRILCTASRFPEICERARTHRNTSGKDKEAAISTDSKLLSKIEW